MKLLNMAAVLAIMACPFLAFAQVNADSAVNNTDSALNKDAIAQTNTVAQTSDNTFIESKVDYLEKIYFSGGNKKALNLSIDATLQSLEGKKASLSLATQYAFLSDIKDNALNASGACDIEEMLSAGIYSLDSGEAVVQGVAKPSKKVARQMLGTLNSVAAISGNTSNNAAGAAVGAFVLTGGRLNVLGGAGVAGALAGKLGAASATANQVSQAADNVRKIGNFFGGDKPCKEVVQKDITIGSHTTPQKTLAAPLASNNQFAVDSSAGNSTVITLNNANYATFYYLQNLLVGLSMFKTMQKSLTNNVGTITVIHAGPTDKLLDALAQKLGTHYEVGGFDTGKIQLNAK